MVAGSFSATIPHHTNPPPQANPRKGLNMELNGSNSHSSHNTACAQDYSLTRKIQKKKSKMTLFNKDIEKRVFWAHLA